MRIYFNIIWSICLLFTLFIGCTKEKYYLNTGDVFGTTEIAAVKVTFDRGDKSFSTVSDQDGKFILKDLQLGVYEITYEKKGYYPCKTFGFQFLGSSSATDCSHTVAPFITDSILVNSIRFGGNHNIIISTNRDPNGSSLQDEFPVRWFINDKQGVSPDHYLQTEYKWDNFLLDSVLFRNASSIYLIGYSTTGFSWNYDYYDWEKRKMVFALGKVPTKEFKVDLPVNFFKQQ